MSALPCKSRKVEHFSGEHTAGVSRVYKTFSLILEKYPTLSRVWVGKYGPRIAESARALCVFPDRRVSAFWRKAQKRFKRQCSLPKHVTKWGKVLISLKLFCQRTRVRAPSQPFLHPSVSPRLFFAARGWKRGSWQTPCARGEAACETIFRACGEGFLRKRVVSSAFSGKTLLAGADDLQPCW